MKPNDPFFSRQWHFGLVGDIGAVWDEFNGAGVHVGVYDTGIDFSNPDLAARQDATRNVLVGGQTRNGAPNNASTDDQNHGTAVAGLLAASGNNGLGTTGVAWGASLTSINIFDTTKPEYVNAQDPKTFLSVAHEMAKFDVANHSWGPPVDFSDNSNSTIASSFASRITAEYAYAAAKGRGGLGTVIVQAAGNEGLDANGAGAHGSRFSITVAATEADGKVASYSNYGGCILVCAPGGVEAKGVVTTDRRGTAGYTATLDDGFDKTGNYSATFNGTSAATPIVSGVVALMLQANPDLTWRDVQNILAVSATHTGSAIRAATLPPADGEVSTWKFNGVDNWNGGGMHYSEDYGFGTVNAFNAVRMAEVWGLFSWPPQTSAREGTVDTGVITAKKKLLDGGSTDFTFQVKDYLTVEHIDLTINATHEFLGDLEIQLISPDGTTMQANLLAAQGPTASNGSGWTFGFEGFRGEAIDGTWTVRVLDTVSGHKGVLNSVRLAGYGDASGSEPVYHFTDEYSEMKAASKVAGSTDNRANLLIPSGVAQWIDAAALHSAVTVDLSRGTATIDGSSLKLTSIDNVVSGDADDRLTGSSGNNILYGMRGDDTLAGKGGFDQLYGGAGDDTFEFSYNSLPSNGVFDGEEGTDVLRLVTGATVRFELDRYLFLGMEGIAIQDNKQSAATTIQLHASQIGIEGFSSSAVIAGLSNAQAADTFAVIMDGQAALDLSALRFVNFSGALDKVAITGGTAAETIVGSAVRDSIDGAAGADRMSGLAGDDTYTVDDAGDIVDEARTGSSGIDTVLTSLSISLASASRFKGAIENATLLGTAGLTLTGNALANRLTGNSGSNRLDGAAGADVMAGLGGNDTYCIDNAGDVADESLAGSSGTDKVQSATRSIDLSDVAHFKGAIENAVLTGTAALNLAGNALANLLTGNAGKNALDGAAGADRMRGLGGNDTYLVDNKDDIVDEAAAGSDGIDTVKSALVGINLADTAHFRGEIEYAVLTGSLALNLSGNALGNLLVGNAGANTISGGEGADRLRGMGGNDTYVVDTRSDVADESVAGSAGIDTVAAAGFSIDLRDTAHFRGEIENATLTGVLHLGLTGNALANVLTGNAGMNTLDGREGRDTLHGGAGNDIFVFDTALESGNFDTIADFGWAGGDDAIRLAKSVFASLVGEAGAMLSAGQFAANTAGAAQDEDDRILYDTQTGALFYDADGSTTATAKVQFAQLGTAAIHPALTNADFFLA